MAELSGRSAIEARQAALSARWHDIAAVDQQVVAALRQAYLGSTTARARLDAIAAELDACAPGSFPTDTALGAREFQRFLIGKNREVIAIIAGAQRDAAEKQTLIESLRPRYSAGFA